jgi:hypothetical protein
MRSWSLDRAAVIDGAHPLTETRAEKPRAALPDLIPNVYGLFATLWGGRSWSERMVMKFEELVLVAALVVGLITTGWAVLAMAALQ